MKKENLLVVTIANKNLSLIGLCVGFFMVMMDVTVINVVIPTIAKDLNSTMSELQWIVDSYTLTFACLLLSSGYLADRIGAKSTFLWGLSLFIFISLLCGIAPSSTWLITFRLFQGVAAALVVPTSLAIINASYENKKERSKAIGIWGSIGGIAAACGPVLGAALTSWFNWRLIFFINIPIGLLGILLTVKYVHQFAKRNKNNFDFLGQFLGIISIAFLAYSLIGVGKFGWLSENVILPFLVFVITFTTFLTVEHRSTHPMFPLTFFKVPTFSLSIVIGMILNIGFYGILFILPFYFQQIRQYSVFMTGLAVLPLLGLAVIASYIGGRLCGHFGPKLPIMSGLLLGAIGFLAMLVTQAQTPAYFILILPLAAISFGTALTMPAVTIAIMNSVARGCAGIASGALNASRQLGSLIGVAFFGSLISISSHFMTGMHITLLVSGLLFLSASLATFFFIGKSEK